MGKPTKIFFAVLIIAAVGIGTAAWYLSSHDFSAKSTPSAVETYLARNLRRFAIPTRARALQNPIPSSPEVLWEAMEHFADHCAACHGTDGAGRTPIGTGLYPPPPDMSLTGTQQLTDGELYFIIESGVRFTGMPGFGENPADEHDAATWKLVHFIRHLPVMTADEVIGMDGMVPKSPADIAREKQLQEFLKGGDTPAAEKSPKHQH